MDGSNPIIFVAVIAILFILTFIVYLYNSAVQNISDSELEDILEENEILYNKLNNVIDIPTSYITTVQVLTVLTTLLSGVYIGIENDSILYGIAYGAAWVFLFIGLGTIVPKQFGKKYPVGVLKKLTNTVYVIRIVLFPVTLLISYVFGYFLKIFGIDLNAPEENVTEEDIISVINEGHEQGVLLASEAEMINNIVEFGDKEAVDIMTHRTGIVAIDGSMLLSEAAELILKYNKSRFPVYEEDIDNIIGIVNFRDIMTYAHNEKNNLKKLKDINGLIREATFIPETKKINLLFKTMQSEKIHMAVVVDEYGQTSGIVAMEDILEEIVGNILDEYDEEDANIVRREDGAYVIKGVTTLEEITDKLNIEFDGDYETINGYLTNKFARILSSDERPEIVINNIKYKILNVKNRVITVVLVTFLDNEKVN